MNEAASPEELQGQPSVEQTQIDHATQIAQKVHDLAALRATLVETANNSKATAEAIRGELDKLDPELLAARAALYALAGTAGAKPQDE